MRDMYYYYQTRSWMKFLLITAAASFRIRFFEDLMHFRWSQQRNHKANRIATNSVPFLNTRRMLWHRLDNGLVERWVFLRKLLASVVIGFASVQLFKDVEPWQRLLQQLLLQCHQSTTTFNPQQDYHLPETCLLSII